MRFTKAHGTGNDFVVLADLDDDVELTPTLVRALCHRRIGIGADGVLRIAPPSGAAAVFMDYRNADGGIVEMCGNGVRVVAKHVADHGLVDVGDRFAVGTRAGDKPVELHRDDRGLVSDVTVEMGPPIWTPADVPFDADTTDPVLDEEVQVGGTPVRLTVVSMGNPHAVLRVDDVDTAPVHTLGPQLERHERFPKRANVSFAQVVSRDRVRLRVWERGVGETAACGTGACATAVALHQLGDTEPDVTVELPGGALRVRHTPDGVRMTGPAVEVASGTLDDTWLAAARAGRLESGGRS